MVKLYAARHAAARALRRVGGTRRWGRLDVDLMPYGMTRYRLVVYPPGITPGAQLRVRAWRAWPLTGAPMGLTAALATSTQLAAPFAIAVGCAVYLGGFVVLGKAALPQRRLVRQVWAADPGQDAGLDDVLGEARIQLLAELLCAADMALAEGELTAADHLSVWTFVYREVDGMLALDIAGTAPSPQA